MAEQHANWNERLSHARARSPAFILDLDGTLVTSSNVPGAYRVYEDPADL
jgi:hypothetical protein